MLEEVYGEARLEYDSYPAQALHELVKVDLNITGCPIEKEHFLAAVAALLNGDLPLYPEYPVCTECRMRENNCLLIERGRALLRPGDGGRLQRAVPGPARARAWDAAGRSATPTPLRCWTMFEEKGFDRQQHGGPVAHIRAGGGRPMSAIVIEHLARVEGHGGITVELEGDTVANVRFDVFEGARLLEPLVKGKRYDEVAPILSRICSICSAAHTLTSLKATENAFGIRVSPQTEMLRELLLRGESIESHALHLFLLAVPDYLNYPERHRHGGG